MSERQLIHEMHESYWWVFDLADAAIRIGYRVVFVGKVDAVAIGGRWCLWVETPASEHPDESRDKIRKAVDETAAALRRQMPGTSGNAG